MTKEVLSLWHRPVVPHCGIEGGHQEGDRCPCHLTEAQRQQEAKFAEAEIRKLLRMKRNQEII